MKRPVAVIAILGMLVGLSACGSSGSPAARSQASSACGDLLDIAANIVERESVTTQTAEQTLARAEREARRAADLDESRWGAFAGLVAAIVSDLEHGNRRPLAAHLTELGRDCTGLEVKTTVPTT